MTVGPDFRACFFVGKSPGADTGDAMNYCDTVEKNNGLIRCCGDPGACTTAPAFSPVCTTASVLVIITLLLCTNALVPNDP